MEMLFDGFVVFARATQDGSRPPYNDHFKCRLVSKRLPFTLHMTASKGCHMTVIKYNCNKIQSNISGVDFWIQQQL